MNDKKTKKGTESAKAFCEDDKQIPSDIFGSYTGTSEDDEEPVQDADDL